jgi:hypothetical protein
MAKKASSKLEVSETVGQSDSGTAAEAPRGLGADLVIPDANTANTEVCPPAAFKPCRRISLRQARELHAKG